MNKYKVTDTQLAAIADAIRTKTGDNNMLEFPDGFVSAVNGIELSVDDDELTFTLKNAISLTPRQSTTLGTFARSTGYGWIRSVLIGGQVRSDILATTTYNSTTELFSLRLTNNNSNTQTVSSGTVIKVRIVKYSLA